MKAKTKRYVRISLIPIVVPLFYILYFVQELLASWKYFWILFLADVAHLHRDVKEEFHESIDEKVESGELKLSQVQQDDED